MAGEALIDLFSSLSQKRKHGTLRLTAAGALYELAFFDGKIVDVHRPAASDARDICSRLVKAGIVHDKVYQLVQAKPITVSQLFDLLVSKKFVTAADFQRAKRAHSLDILHALGFAEDASYEFLSRDLRPDPRFPLSVSPSQLLLDFCELQSDEERFQANFGSGSAPIARGKDEPKGLCDFERAVWQVLSGSKRAADLFRSLLSEYEVKEGLLALLDRGLIAVQKPGAPAPAGAPAADEEEDLQLMEVEDQTDLMGKIAFEAVGSILESLEDNLTLSELTEAVFETPAAESKKTPVSPAPPPKPVGPERTAPRPSIVSAPEEPTPVRAASVRAAPSGEFSLFSLVLRFLGCVGQRGLKGALFEMNHEFLETRALEQITLVTVLAYLVSLAIFCFVGIGLIDPWFRALDEFTSAANSFVVE